MKTVAHWASWNSLLNPICRGLRPIFTVLVGAALLATFCAVHGALAAAAAPAVPSTDLLAAIVQLYGPACGILVAVILFFERVARVIPNSTNNQILKGLLTVATVFGVKVPDNQ